VDLDGLDYLAELQGPSSRMRVICRDPSLVNVCFEF